MKNKRKALACSLWLGFMGFLGGCASVNSGNDGQVQSYPAPVIEAEWIRNGEPIEFDGAKWYPVNDYEILQDTDVFQVIEYKGVQVFVAKIDTKPYKRIYTKFDKNKFRYFERHDNDQG
jgi:hypothetical protein